MSPVTRHMFFGVWFVSALILLPHELAAQDSGGGDIMGVSGCSIVPVSPAPGDPLCLCKVLNFQGEVDEWPTEYVRFRIVPESAHHPGSVSVKVVISGGFARFSPSLSDTWERSSVPCPSNEIVVPVFFNEPGTSYVGFEIDGRPVIQMEPLELRCNEYKARVSTARVLPSQPANKPSGAGTIDLMLGLGGISGNSIRTNGFRSHADAFFDKKTASPVEFTWQTSVGIRFYYAHRGTECTSNDMLPTLLTYSQESDVHFQAGGELFYFSGSKAQYQVTFGGDFFGFPGVFHALPTYSTDSMVKDRERFDRNFAASEFGSPIEFHTLLVPDQPLEIWTYLAVHVRAAWVGKMSCWYDASGVKLCSDVEGCGD